MPKKHCHERETDRERDREREGERDRQRETERERGRERQRERQREREGERKCSSMHLISTNLHKSKSKIEESIIAVRNMLFDRDWKPFHLKG